MKNVQKIDLGLTGYDELFANDEERKVNKLPRIFDIPISEIDDFPDHPFKVKIDEDMDQLVQSIKERGIITPVTLRPKEDGRYEIVSGHRRKKACELAGLDTVKAEVREMSRDEAIILMVESNLQRSTILPSEKAFSYKMRLEAMNRQGQRTDLTSVPVAQKSTSREQLGKEVGESQDQVRRYIRLTQLMFKETADIQTADMLNLPVPEAHYHNIVLKPSEAQKKMVEGLSDRAERVRNKMVDSSTDNMLLITNDGRKLALDQRLMNDMLPDSETSKVSACADNVFDIWQRTAESRSTQMVFCDLSAPHNDGKFNVYDDLRKKLIEEGIPAEEIAYIHTAETEAKKKELFGKVRSGQIRVLLGSTQKMGAGTNVQTKLVALHHLDCPWRPSDLQQREGRIIRQGNENPEVDIYTYVTENTFDSYLYQLVEGKQKFIGQIMTSKSPVRSAEDIDETALSYAEIKALCAGNPHIKEKMDLDIDVSRLKLLKANHLSQRYALEDQIIKEFPQKIKSLEQRIDGYKADMAQLAQNTLPNEDGFSSMIMAGGTVTDKKAAGEAIIGLCKSMTNPDPIHIGEYRGFDMELFFDSFSREYKITLKHELRHTVTLGTDIFGNIQRLDNALNSFQEKLTACEAQLENTKVQLENAKLEVQKPFPQEDELKTKTARLNELNAMLNLDKRENEIVDGERAEEEPSRSSDDRER